MPIDTVSKNVESIISKGPWSRAKREMFSIETERAEKPEGETHMQPPNGPFGSELRFRPLSVAKAL